jgi:hypothetical protein
MEASSGAWRSDRRNANRTKTAQDRPQVTNVWIERLLAEWRFLASHDLGMRQCSHERHSTRNISNESWEKESREVPNFG